MGESGHGTRFVSSILLGVDGSDGSVPAVEWAAQFALMNEAVVVAVHVLTYNSELLRDITPDTAITTWRRELRAALETKWTRTLDAHGVHHRCLLVEDDNPARGLIRSADQEQSDLIVIGSRGRSSFAGRFLGATSLALTHQAHRPVVVVPPDWCRPGQG